MKGEELPLEGQIFIASVLLLGIYTALCIQNYKPENKHPRLQALWDGFLCLLFIFGCYGILFIIILIPAGILELVKCIWK